MARGQLQTALERAAEAVIEYEDEECSGQPGEFLTVAEARAARANAELSELRQRCEQLEERNAQLQRDGGRAIPQAAEDPPCTPARTRLATDSDAAAAAAAPSATPMSEWSEGEMSSRVEVLLAERLEL